MRETIDELTLKALENKRELDRLNRAAGIKNPIFAYTDEQAKQEADEQSEPSNSVKQPSGAFQEGRDAALLGQAMNPYRRALRAVSGQADRRVLGELAEEWDNGFVSAGKPAR